jgi:hypothetical protein
MTVSRCLIAVTGSGSSFQADFVGLEKWFRRDTRWPVETDDLARARQTLVLSFWWSRMLRARAVADLNPAAAFHRLSDKQRPAGAG